MAVCSIWVLGGGGRNTVPYLPKIYGKPCTWRQDLNLELSFETLCYIQLKVPDVVA